MRSILAGLLLAAFSACTTLDEPTVPFSPEGSSARDSFSDATPTTNPPRRPAADAATANGGATTPPPPSGCSVVHHDLGDWERGYKALFQLEYHGAPLPRTEHNAFIVTLNFAAPVSLGVWQNTGFIIGHIGYLGNQVTIPIQPPTGYGYFGSSFNAFEFGANVNSHASVTSVRLGEVGCALSHR